MAPKAAAAGQRGSALKAAGRTVSTTAPLVNGHRNAATPKAPHPKAMRCKVSAPSVHATERQVPAGKAHKVAAAVLIQAWFRGHLGRCFALRHRMRIEQRKLEDKYEQEEHARREAAANAKREADEAAQLEKEKQKEARLRAYRERRGAVELMCQALSSQIMPWEEDAGRLFALLESSTPCNAEAWLGQQSSRRAARKQYLLLARKWHPDKWSMQGEQCIAVATAVTKALVNAHDWMSKNLPPDDLRVSCEDADEEAEVYEFASWVGVAFEGMFEVYKERKGVTRGK